jgi:hypothetical protein
MAKKVQAYRARRPKLSPLWQCLDGHFDAFVDIYPETYEHDYGFLCPIIPEVVGKFMGCGDFAKGFACVRCDLEALTFRPPTHRTRYFEVRGAPRTLK